MARIDLFTAPCCAACAAARQAVSAFAAQRSGLEVHEWDLTRDPGPARGRGIFATPSLLLDGQQILLGVPSTAQLASWFGAREE